MIESLKNFLKTSFEPNFHLWVFILAVFSLIVAIVTLYVGFRKEKLAAQGNSQKIKDAKVILYLGLAGCIVLFGTSFSSLWTDQKQEIEKLQQRLDDSTFKIKSEISRVQESNILRGKSDSLLSEVGLSLKYSDSLLNEQRRQLKTTSNLLGRHIEMSKYIVGATGVPKLTMEISDFGSSSQYKVHLFLTNNDSYAYHDIEFFLRDMNNINKHLKDIEMLPYDSIQVRYDKLFQGYSDKGMSFILPKQTSKDLLFSYYSLFNKREYFGTSEVYQILIQWSTGYYRVSFRLDVKDLIPELHDLEVQNEGKIIKLTQNEKNKFFFFDNRITKAVADSLKSRIGKFRQTDLRREIQTP